MTYSWVLPGARKRVPYENLQRRRYNTMVLYAREGPYPALDWIGSPRHFTAADLVHFLLERPAHPVPLVVAIDNASLHRSHEVREALPRLWARRIYLYYLPPYSPELNDAERLFRHVKHHELPARVYTPLTALEQAVDGAFTRCEENLLAQYRIQPRLAA